MVVWLKKKEEGKGRDDAASHSRGQNGRELTLVLVLVVVVDGEEEEEGMQEQQVLQWKREEGLRQR